MTTVQYFAFQASIMGLGMALAPLLQIRRIILRRHAGDISQAFVWVIVAGASSYAAYGIVKPDWYIAVPNLVGVATNIGTLVVVRYYVRRHARAQAAVPAHPPAV